MTAAGVTSYKVYLAYDNLRLWNSAAYEAVRAVGGRAALWAATARTGTWSPRASPPCTPQAAAAPRPIPFPSSPLVEAEAVGRWLAIGEMAGCPVNIVHLSTRRALAGPRRPGPGPGVLCGDLPAVSAAGRGAVCPARL